ncbi:Blp family class II bacteriocin [Romboutsia sedimentorum]|uniref:Blp family class II bacteriocin n=1 Tax=Romboutsia sedimentorum TaxID=1368474 RepID=A0ABT7E9M8_9FIRM|nr:Blp family class II bacteriocin [Romboutsia sedimentorum]MDK2563640.1 Blp family class II bacteriocin [Romboutsia sedimentorum]MDK2586003.1 Blp family class II bacteriocin [Romboutsia sedimentorum]
MENICILNDRELNEVNGGKITISPKCLLTTAGGALMGSAAGVPGAIAGGAFAAYTTCW